MLVGGFVCGLCSSVVLVIFFVWVDYLGFFSSLLVIFFVFCCFGFLFGLVLVLCVLLFFCWGVCVCLLWLVVGCVCFVVFASAPVYILENSRTSKFQCI